MLKLLRRITYLLRQRHVDDDLRREVEFHRAMEAERLERGGLDRATAHSASVRRMGNVTLAREDARAVWIAPWLEDLQRDIAYAFRMLVKRPGFTFAIVLVMGLGIGSTTGVFGLLDALVLKSLPVREPDRLVFLEKPSFSYPVFTEIRSRGTHASPLAISHGATTMACLRARAIASLRWNRRLGIHLQPPTSASCVCSRKTQWTYRHRLAVAVAAVVSSEVRC